jgi:hypothetical protein
MGTGRAVKKKKRIAKNKLVDIQPFGVDLCGKPATGMRFVVMKSADPDGTKGVTLKKNISGGRPEIYAEYYRETFRRLMAAEKEK